MKERFKMTKKELIFLGPPACGKGTQTNKLAEYLNFPHIDTGSLLRAEIKGETEAGKEAKSYIDKGQLVPVELVTRIIKNRLSQDDCKNGYILDGFPRSVEQAGELEKLTTAKIQDLSQYILILIQAFLLKEL